MSSYTIEVVTLELQPTLSMRFTSKVEDLAGHFGRVLPAVYEYATSMGAEIAGPPFGWYHAMTDDGFDVEAGIQVRSPVAGQGEIEASSLPAGRAATTWHFGPYDQLGAAHEALACWANENNESPTSGAWDIYVTDPGEVPDPKDWKTQLFLPLG